jgi:hypothetical protein
MFFLSSLAEHSVWILVPMAAFCTALWDRLLRFGVRSVGVFPVMQPYFAAWTALGAMFNAFLTGAFTTALIIVLASAACGAAGLRPALTPEFLAWTALVSAIVGLAMRWEQVFPPLGTTYYAQPVLVTFSLDALSGVMVMLPVIALTGNFKRADVCPRRHK